MKLDLMSYDFECDDDLKLDILRDQTNMLKYFDSIIGM